MIKDKDWS